MLKAWQHLQRLFLGGHLGACSTRFTTAVKAGRGYSFYRELAERAERFVGIELTA